MSVGSRSYPIFAVDGVRKVNTPESNTPHPVRFRHAKPRRWRNTIRRDVQPVASAVPSAMSAMAP